MGQSLAGAELALAMAGIGLKLSPLDQQGISAWSYQSALC